MTLIEDPYCSRYFSNSSFTFAMFAFTRACKSFPHSISCPISKMHPAFRASRSFSIVYFLSVRPLPVMRASAESEVMTYRVGTTSTVGLDVPGMYSCGKGKSHNESRPHSGKLHEILCPRNAHQCISCHGLRSKTLDQS